MKRLLVSCLALAFVLSLNAQTPQAFNYQAVVRNDAGELITEQAVSLRISILEESSSGSTVFRETHSALINSFGIVAITIGEGTSDIGDISLVQWSEKLHFIKVELDTEGGSSFTEMGTSQLLSVPYAFHAETAANVENHWNQESNKLFAADTVWNIGVGTKTPSAKLEVKGSSPTAALFEVKDEEGNTVFAVYPDGATIIVPDGADAERSGFTVKGRNDSLLEDYMRVTPDSIRFYIRGSDDGLKSTNRGGFAITGRAANKDSGDTDYFNVYNDTVARVLNPSQPRIFWYPLKEAFIVGRAIVESPDSVGQNSLATGFESKAIGDYSQAMGYAARAAGTNSTALGYEANALGGSSYAFGNQSVAMDSAYAFGTGALALGLRSFAIGSKGVDFYEMDVGPTIASGDYSYSFGMGSVSTHQGAFALGTQDSAMAPYAMAMGYKSKATGNFAVALGSNCLASGDGSFAAGGMSTASGQSSIAIGTNCISSEYASFAAGNSAWATGQNAIAMGNNTRASGASSTAIGDITKASGHISTAIGYDTEASGMISMATGSQTRAVGYASTAMGSDIVANADWTFGIGLSNPWPAASPVIAQPNTMAIMGGNVGIGTVSPDKTLHVFGDMRVTGDIYYGTGHETYTKPDFVFKKNYDKYFEILDIEEFIKINSHLPWVTSAKEETDGINLTRMGFETLEAVENMQLQIIELKKENIELLNQLEKRDKEIQLVLKRLQILEERLEEVEE